MTVAPSVHGVPALGLPVARLDADKALQMIRDGTAKTITILVRPPVLDASAKMTRAIAGGL
mgnify:CR=1 FL=1